VHRVVIKLVSDVLCCIVLCCVIKTPYFFCSVSIFLGNHCNCVVK